MHRTLLELRRSDPVMGAQAPGGVAGAIVGPGACVLRFSASAARASPGVRDRLLVINLGNAIDFDVIPYPLLAAAGEPWSVLWSSEDAAWGSATGDALQCRTTWRIPAESAWLLG
jgi:hypothetical protein